uniref:Uncharacterized protein n=1 Tax=Avena sativa TaxID=4498 RepID=A0ACD5W7I8_AVESA
MYQVTLTHGKKKPELSRIPDPKPCLLLPTDLGIYCPADAPGEYILAGLCPTRNAEAHELHLYSSKTNAWTMKRARLANPKWEEEHLPVRPHKVIPLGGSLLGWVDLWKGVLVCDVLSPYRVVFLRFVPFPGRLPGNTTCHLCPWKVRDFVACTNGALKFVEIEHFPEPSSESVAAEDPPDIVYDDPPPSAEPNDDRDTEPPSLFGWRCIMWNRVLSGDCWLKGCDVRSHDMLVHNASPSALLAAGLGWGNSYEIIDLLPSFPNLSIHGDDVVHLKSLLRLDLHDVPKRHMISIDMRSKALKTLVPCAAPARLDAYCPHFTCALSSHLSNTPGN